MLRGLHPSPGDAARNLLNQFGPVVSIDRAKRKGGPSGQVPPERWTLALVIARWLARLGWQQEAPPAQTRPAADSNELHNDLLTSMRRQETERMVAIFADARGRILSQELVAEGDHNQLRLSLRQIFKKALNRDARRMVIAHNHPSGCTDPSDHDVVSTQRLNEYSRSLGIVLEDHLIIGTQEITSMRSLGYL